MTDQPRSYEELYTELEQAVARLEAGDLPLEEALREYERGVGLASQCQRLLDGAELRIQQVMNGEIAPWESDR
jgi:exodeoxyribonuclease VII small subunit